MILTMMEENFYVLSVAIKWNIGILVDFDTETNKVVKRWREPERAMNNPIITSGTSVKMNPVVTCPYCNSTNTKKISLTAKAVNTALFGILGTKRHKQWHCNKCGSEW